MHNNSTITSSDTTSLRIHPKHLKQPLDVGRHGCGATPSSGMPPSASRSAGHAPLGTRCHAAGRNSIAFQEISTSPGEISARLPAGLRPHPHFWCHSSKHLECWKEDYVAEKRTAIYCRSSCKSLLHVRPLGTVYFTFLAFHCCQKLSKKQPWQLALTFETNTASNDTWPNIATKFARRGTHEKLCFSQVGPAGTTQLLPRSGRNLRDNDRKFNFSTGELRKTSSRSAAPSAPLVPLQKHLEGSKEDCEDIQPLREDGILIKDPPSN